MNMQEKLELIVLTTHRDIPVHVTRREDGRFLLSYSIDVDGDSLNITQHERPTARPLLSIPAGIALNILLTPPQEGETTRHAVTTQMSKQGRCPECGTEDTEIGAVLADPDSWSCIECIEKEIQEATGVPRP